ncbi:hypothetical protein [Hyunsoonleella ulvae]|uniref:hypothetical protein n=1 Tax=Hyunsoonleella ulvae TaxID=2799948 RepID=UPI00193A4B7D|nr:hypothetical protein [Hyunsoonleella ulvae]
MKKIIGILSVTMILAVAFFNVSSILQTEEDINLASLDLIQNANAESSGGVIKYVKANFPSEIEVKTFHYKTGTPQAYSCTRTYSHSSYRECWPGGTSDCTPITKVTIELSSTCPPNP